MNSGYVRCWICVGNGYVYYPVKGQMCWERKLCPDCQGSGKDEKKTKELRKHNGTEVP